MDCAFVAFVGAVWYLNFILRKTSGMAFNRRVTHRKAL